MILACEWIYLFSKGSVSWQGPGFRDGFNPTKGEVGVGFRSRRLMVTLSGILEIGIMGGTFVPGLRMGWSEGGRWLSSWLENESDLRVIVRFVISGVAIFLGLEF